MTMGDLRKYWANVPDDAALWIEYPARYGLAQPERIIHYPTDDGMGEEQDFIECLTMGYDEKSRRFILFHHF